MGMPSSVQQDSNIVCKICRRQISRYTCPECNLAYCSSTCFKSPAHTNCSQAFYKKQIEADVRSESSSKSAEERLKMMEILKRFEENNMEQDELVGEDEDNSEGEDNFERRFSAIDIASASPDALWNFSSARNYRTNLHKNRELIDIPTTMVKPLPIGPPLIYNLCAVCIAYAFVTRRLATSPLSTLSYTIHSQDSEEVKHLLAQLVPFVMDRKSKVLHTSLSTAIDDVWSRFDKSAISSSTFTVLMRDTATLVRPLPIGIISSPDPSSYSTSASSNSRTTVVDLTSHPNRPLVYVLSDLHRLFANQNPNQKSNYTHVAHKLLFYAAHALSTPPLVLRSLADDLAFRAKEAEKAPVIIPEQVNAGLSHADPRGTTSQPTMKGLGLDSENNANLKNLTTNLIEEI
ncbi:zinc finger hit domain-containing protein 2-like [Lentinula edodes]|uniref:Zinc finger hit domain-containing protein 2-like n=1 Tax=Lentinula edodes TaxID=5353 RepID=A0A1Q3DUU3_LENED|nr:zinc finger hit domain-containing protein 2-like [Lentinula edodes]